MEEFGVELCGNGGWQLDVGAEAVKHCNLSVVIEGAL